MMIQSWYDDTKYENSNLRNDPGDFADDKPMIFGGESGSTN